MKNKVISVILVLCLCLMSFVGCSTKKENVDTGTGAEYEYVVRDLPEAKYITPAENFAGGDGSEENPYQISNAQELALIQKKITQGDSAYKTAYYVLTDDIALNDVSDFENWETTAPEYSWMPIGFGVSQGFEGIFDGAGYTISGMYINTNAETANQEEYGLFSRVFRTVKNVKLEQSFVAVSGYKSDVGSIAGACGWESFISNCTADTYINTYDNTCGGIVGSVQANVNLADEDYIVGAAGTVEKCTFNGIIKQIKKDSVDCLGGIAGTSSGLLKECINNGAIQFNNGDVDAVGGIVGMANNNSVTNCTNKSDIIAERAEKETVTRIGGVVGVAMLTATGGEPNMSRGLSIIGCSNEGKINAQYYAGGIVSYANNSNNNYTLTIADCVNKGEIISDKSLGGIAGYLLCQGDNENGESVIVKNCVNEATLSGDMTGGLIGTLTTQKGDVVLENCQNRGKLTASGIHCAGIVAYWLMESKPKDFAVAVKNCDNSGNISSSFSAGGIISYMDMPVEIEKAKNVNIDITECDNTGDVTSSTSNGAVGGVIGVLGMQNIYTCIMDCTNSGVLHITEILSEEEANGTAEKVMTVSRVIGGIVGRIGKGLSLTVDNDNGKDKNVDTDNGYFNLKGCTNTGYAVLADDREGVNFKNYLGGVIGYISGEKDYSILVQDCRYRNFERGQGNTEFSDVGTKLK